MAWPSSTIPTTNLDADTDSILAARADLKAAVDALNQIISHLTGQTIWTSETDGPTSGLEAQKVGGFNVKVVDIGDWNMDSTNSKGVVHGLDYTKIRQVGAIVRNDVGNLHYDLTGINAAETAPQGFIGQINSTGVNLYRSASGIFDSSSFASTSYNRGWLTIWYVD